MSTFVIDFYLFYFLYSVQLINTVHFMAIDFDLHIVQYIFLTLDMIDIPSSILFHLSILLQIWLYNCPHHHYPFYFYRILLEILAISVIPHFGRHYHHIPSLHLFMYFDSHRFLTVIQPEQSQILIHILDQFIVLSIIADVFHHT